MAAAGNDRLDNIDVAGRVLVGRPKRLSNVRLDLFATSAVKRLASCIGHRKEVGEGWHCVGTIVTAEREHDGPLEDRYEGEEAPEDGGGDCLVSQAYMDVQSTARSISDALARARPGHSQRSTNVEGSRNGPPLSLVQHQAVHLDGDGALFQGFRLETKSSQTSRQSLSFSRSRFSSDPQKKHHSSPSWINEPEGAERLQAMARTDADGPHGANRPA
ncbi:hypothetical protein QQZ08_010141 [Neonectria magnoliae]|uniref:Uncharacterized protein n=1 Tax=Neonectria magnoliae TaxID=2732573 RepID=A0ABR1HIK6_9HYPO